MPRHVYSMYSTLFRIGGSLGHRLKDLENLCDGETLVVGGKEIEVWCYLTFSIFLKNVESFSYIVGSIIDMLTDCTFNGFNSRLQKWMILTK